jgi:tetratricopeptide (TPR) repeat protein
MLHIFLAVILLSTFASAQQPAAAPAPAPPPGSPQDLVQQGEKLSHEGKQDEALAFYSQAMEKAPRFYDAQLETGIALDLKGEYGQARKHLSKAIDIAGPDHKVQALRAMAISYAFEGNAHDAAPFEKQVIDDAIELKNWIAGGEICDELGRIYLDSGDPKNALKWYQKGYDTATRKPDLTDDEKNLWLFRWESAQTRIAIREGHASLAQHHLLAAKTALDNAHNPEQMRFYPYLAGYVAFYSGDDKTAIAELQKADQHDPMILALLGESYERSGDKVQAKDYYRKVLEVNSHNPPNAFARPLAKKKLATGA